VFESIQSIPFWHLFKGRSHEAKWGSWICSEAPIVQQQSPRSEVWVQSREGTNLKRSEQQRYCPCTTENLKVQTHSLSIEWRKLRCAIDYGSMNYRVSRWEKEKSSQLIDGSIVIDGPGSRSVVVFRSKAREVKAVVSV